MSASSTSFVDTAVENKAPNPTRGGFLTRGVIVPPSKLIVTIFVPPKGGFLIRGLFLLRGGG